MNTIRMLIDLNLDYEFDKIRQLTLYRKPLQSNDFFIQPICTVVN